MTRRWASRVAGVFAALSAVSCGGGEEGSFDINSPPCPPEAQRQLLSQRVGETPTDAFTITAGATPYVMVAVRSPTDSGLSGGIGGVATLRVIAAGAAPQISTDEEGHRVSSDPKVNIGKARRWQRLDLRPGDYRFYSLAGAPTVEVMSCPG
jgi:hypothetical protein